MGKYRGEGVVFENLFQPVLYSRKKYLRLVDLSSAMTERIKIKIKAILIVDLCI